MPVCDTSSPGTSPLGCGEQRNELLSPSSSPLPPRAPVWFDVPVLRRGAWSAASPLLPSSHPDARLEPKSLPRRRTDTAAPSNPAKIMKNSGKMNGAAGLSWRSWKACGGTGHLGHADHPELQPSINPPAGISLTGEPGPYLNAIQFSPSKADWIWWDFTTEPAARQGSRESGPCSRQWAGSH